MIWGVVGWPGAGKTYGAVHMALQMFRTSAKRGDYLQVYANMAGLRCPEAIYIDALEDFVGITNGLVLLDEAGVFLSSRFWQQVPKELLMALAQVRKNGLDMIWVTQHEARVDTVLRELTAVLIRCRKFGRYSIQQHEDPLAKTSIGRKVVKLTQDVFDLYDTFEVIGTHGGTDGRGGAATSTVARRRASGEDERRKALARSRQRPLLSWSENWAYPHRETVAASDYLLSMGVSLEVPGWQDVVRNEIERRRWLAVWGLKPEDAPLDCTFESPWLKGHTPRDAAIRAEALREIETLKERSKRKK